MSNKTNTHRNLNLDYPIQLQRRSIHADLLQVMSRIAQKGSDIIPIGKTSPDTLHEPEEEEVPS